MGKIIVSAPFKPGGRCQIISINETIQDGAGRTYFHDCPGSNSRQIPIIRVVDVIVIVIRIIVVGRERQNISINSALWIFGYGSEVINSIAV